ncbi:MAG: 2-dehydropantoate 2-reductase [Lentisphaeraceae bacterium]|nr:2-dehydropantoate 2-reductase [Lentisphaeraceae bacterium]
MKSVAIIGAGAIGAYYGALLAKAGFEVHFLLNSDYEHVYKHGIKIDSPDGDIYLPKVNAWNSAKKLPKCDLVLVTLKTTVNNLLPKILPHCCHQKSKVLVLQNGLGTDKDSADAVPKNEIFGGLCSIASNKIGPGHIKHISYNEIRMGQFLRNGRPAGITKSLVQISELMNSAGISTVLSENITEARWRKLVWNMTFNGLTTLLDCNTKDIMSNSIHRKRAILIMNEVISAAESCGIYIEKDFVQQMVTLTDNMAPYLPSMKLDYMNKRPLELEVIYKRPIEQAKENNCSIHELEKLYSELLSLGK